MIANDEKAAHKFRIGEELTLHTRQRISASPGARYRVTGYRPPEDGEPSYRIKSDLENFERIAHESELS